MPTATPMPTHLPIKPGTTPTTTGAAPISTSAAGVPPGGTTLQPTPTPPQLTATKTPKSAGLPPGATHVVPTTTTTTTAYSDNAITAQNNGKMLLPTVPEEIALGSSLAGAAALVGWYIWRRKQGSLLATQYISQASVPYAQTAYAGDNIGGVSENGPNYSPDIANQEMFPKTQYALDTMLPDDSLEAIMRQARVGLFALPNKEEYS